jgi:hypothetical protein
MLSFAEKHDELMIDLIVGTDNPAIKGRNIAEKVSLFEMEYDD